MNKKYYEGIDETLYHKVLDNGLDVYIVKKEGFANKCAYFASKFGSFNTGDILRVDNKDKIAMATAWGLMDGCLFPKYTVRENYTVFLHDKETERKF